MFNNYVFIKSQINIIFHFENLKFLAGYLRIHAYLPEVFF